MLSFCKWQKKIIFFLILMVFFLLCVEIILRCIYYQRNGRYAFAVTYGIQKVINEKNKILARIKVHNTIKKIGIDAPNDDVTFRIRRRLFYELYLPENQPLLSFFMQEYEKNFVQLIEEVKMVKTKLAVLYIPSEDYVAGDFGGERMVTCRNFYRNLADKYNIHFIDTTDELLKYPLDIITLGEGNGHPSRFSNQIIAKILSDYILKFDNYRSGITFDKRPRIMGDLRPNINEVWEILTDMPFRVISNQQGFRNEYDLEFPKTKQRILILGDSYSFGSYLHNCDIFPTMLDKAFPDKEVINAGYSGNTITDEVSSFRERAKFVEPDITILQVIDNDLFELFYFMKNLKYNFRYTQIYEPSLLEKEFISKIKNKFYKRE